MTTVQVDCFDTQTDLEIPLPQVKKLAHLLCKLWEVKCDAVIFHFVDIPTISSLHRDYFNDPSPTDCISSPLDSPSDKSPLPTVLGEVFVCPAVAIEYAHNHRTDPYLETSLYMAHGMLHLLGHEDCEASAKKKMRAEEKRALCYLKEENGLLHRS